MHINVNRIALLGLALLFAGTIVLVGPRHPIVWLFAVLTAVAGVVPMFLAAPAAQPVEESERVQDLSVARRSELVRGTSLRLREMAYRYSVRHDERGRLPFSARVNQIQLGFVPVIITDNETDVQGLGFVAFVHDGRRWRGPGLPCAGTPGEALTHAARHIEPLRDIEETGDGDEATRNRRLSGASDDPSADDDADDEDSRWDTGSGWDDDSDPGEGGARR